MLILHECAYLRLVALGLLVVAVTQVYFKNGAVGDVRSTTVSSTIGDSVRARLILRVALLAAKEGITSASMALPDVSHSIMARIIGRWFVCAVASRASRVPIGPGTTRPHGSPDTMYPSSPIDQIEIQPARTWATCQKCRLRLSDTSKHSNRGVSSSKRSIHMVSSRSGGSMEDCWNKNDQET